MIFGFISIVVIVAAQKIVVVFRLLPVRSALGSTLKEVRNLLYPGGRCPPNPPPLLLCSFRWSC